MQVPTGEGPRQRHGRNMKMDVTWQPGIGAPVRDTKLVGAGGQKTPLEAHGAKMTSGRSASPWAGLKLQGRGVAEEEIDYAALPLGTCVLPLGGSAHAHHWWVPVGDPRALSHLQ